MDFSQLRDLLDQLENQGAHQDLLDQTFEGAFAEIVGPARGPVSVVAQSADLESSAGIAEHEEPAIQWRAFRREPNEAHWKHDRDSLRIPSLRPVRTKPRSDGRFHR